MSSEQPGKGTLSGLADRILTYGIRPLILVVVITLIGLFIAVNGLLTGDLPEATIGVIITVIGVILGIGFAATTVRRRRPTYRLPQYMVGLVGEARTSIKAGGEGVIFLESELWSAISDSPQDISAGEKVIVTGYDGVKLKVKPHEEE
ncbi:NfeD family protein [Tardisphaera miroshnichenkoae]